MSKPNSRELAERLGCSQRHARRLLAAEDDRIYPDPPIEPKPAHTDGILRFYARQADSALDSFAGIARENLHRYTDSAELDAGIDKVADAFNSVLELIKARSTQE